MKKKTLSVLLAVIMIVGMLPLSVVSAFAKGGTEPSGTAGGLSEPIHEHVYAWNNEMGANGVHTLVCSNADGLCEELTKTEDCTYENGLCTVCGAEETVHVHSYAWNNEIGANGVHTLVCANTDGLCEELTIDEECTYENGICTVCGSEADMLGGSSTKTVTVRYYDTNSGKYKTRDENCTVLTSGSDDWKWNGWLVASGNITIRGRVVVSEDAHLVLEDGCTLTCKDGIEVETSVLAWKDNAHLYIYGQSEDSNPNKGKLIATANKDCAAIGSGYCMNLMTGDICGKITIHGGEINATGGENAAGIGGGHGANGATVTVYGGKIIAKGGECGAGIGGGIEDLDGCGGEGGELTVYGGSLEATGGYNGAGIGGGQEGDGGSLTVWGGSITATTASGDGAGIGGGISGNGGSVVLNGGKFDVSTHKDGRDNAFGRGVDGNSDGTITVGTGLAVFRTSPESGSGGVRINSNFDYQPWETVFFNRHSDSFYIAPCGDPVTYRRYDPIYGDWTASCQSYTYINKGIKNWVSGWYYLDDSGTFKDPVTVSGEVHLIIKDDRTLTAEKGIRVEPGASLNIYAQSSGAFAGKLIAIGANNCAGIGGGAGKSGGVITIHGGDVSAHGGMYAAAIGGGQNGSGGTLRMFGGRLTVNAGAGVSKAIGAGQNSKDRGQIIVRSGYDLYDEVTEKTLVREDGSSTEWTDLVNKAYHILTLTPSSSYSTDPVSYLFYDKDLNLQSADCTLYHLVQQDTEAMESGWYVVKGNIEMNHPFSVLGDVHLILTDGSSLTVNGGVCINDSGHSLTIHAQSEDESSMGTLTAIGNGCAGIGANNDLTAGDVTIDGGKINAVGSGYSAGIGGSYLAGFGSIKIHGGIVDAKSTSAGAGIGGGYYDAAFDYEYDDWEAADVFEFYDYGHNGTIEITGGIVNAEGEGCGAGIGGGEGYDAGTITITGGTVTAKGGANGTGIGSGHATYWNDWGWEMCAPIPGGEVSITGGDVTAIGGDDRKAFLSDTLNIKETLSVYVNDSAVPVENASDYANSCRNADKAHILANPHDVGGSMFTVSFEMNGHGTQIAEQKVAAGGKASKPDEPSESGWTFGGWYTNSNFNTKFDFNTAITANTTVYAKWTKNSSTLTDPSSLNTGDNGHMFPWIALLLAGGGVVVGTTVHSKKRKRTE